MQAFIQYLQSKGHAATTQTGYVRDASLFLAWLGRDAATVQKKDVLNYLTYLQNKKQYGNAARSKALVGLKHYFAFHATQNEGAANPTALLKIRGTHKRQLCSTYTTKELQTLCDNYHHQYIRNFDDSHLPKNLRAPHALARQRNYIILGLLAHQGLATNEPQNINLADLDLHKAQLKINSSLTHNERILPLDAAQIGSLIHYVQTIRPQFLTDRADNGKLFYPLPTRGQQGLQAPTIEIVKPLAKHLRGLDKNFVNLHQLRTSAITNWLKTHGLRQAQYYAGHRYISSTEQYQANNIEGLIDDIHKYNPF